MRDDDTTEDASRQSPSTTTSVRLFNGLGGVELGVRHSGHKAMLFVRIRKLVIAGWWKAPGIPGKTPMDRFAADAAARRAAVRAKDAPEVDGITASASVTHAAGVAEIGKAPEPAPEQERPWIPGRIIRGSEPAASTRVIEPETAVIEAEVVQPAAEVARPAAQVIAPDATAELADDQNVMHRLWKRVTAPFKKGSQASLPGRGETCQYEAGRTAFSGITGAQGMDR